MTQTSWLGNNTAEKTAKQRIRTTSTCHKYNPITLHWIPTRPAIYHLQLSTEKWRENASKGKSDEIYTFVVKLNIRTMAYYMYLYRDVKRDSILTSRPYSWKLRLVILQLFFLFFTWNLAFQCLDRETCGEIYNSLFQ